MAPRRAAILAPLAAQQACSRAEAKAAGAALGLSERQVYNWVRRLRLANGNVAALTRRGVRTTKGVTRLAPEIEEQLSRIIAEETGDRPGHRETGQFAAIVRRCRREMAAAPSASTIFRRLRNCAERRPAKQAAVSERPSNIDPYAAEGPG
jgi:hypothetical protein